MKKYVCSVCGREVADVVKMEGGTRVKLDVPLAESLTYSNTLKNVDMCEECATRITFAGNQAEVWEYYLIRYQAGENVPIERLPPECRAQAMLELEKELEEKNNVS